MRLVLLLFLLLGSHPVWAVDIAALLAQPPSPGTVATLVLEPQREGVREHWAAALRDENPQTRAAAARVITTSSTTALLADLRQVLASERDIDAAKEEILGLASMGDSSDDAALFAAAERFGPRGVGALALGLAKGRGMDALVHLPALRKLTPDSPFEVGNTTFRTFIGWATGGGAPELTRTASIALREPDYWLWEAALWVAAEHDALIDGSVLVVALDSPNPRVRECTYWYIVFALGRGHELDRVLLEALTQRVEAARPAEPDEAFPLELAGRLLGRRPVEQKLVDTQRGRRTLNLARVQRVLTKRERQSLFGNRGPREGPLSMKTDWAPREVEMATAGPFPRGLVAGVLAATGCDPRSAQGSTAAVLTFGRRARPRGLTFQDMNLPGVAAHPPACFDAGRALLTASHDRAPRSVGEQEMLLVFLNPDALGCLAEDPPQFDFTIGPRDYRPAKKTRNTPPTYPGLAKQARKGGSVKLDAIITATGCVQSTRFLEGDPFFAYRSMLALLSWRYAPALVDGKPIPDGLLSITFSYSIGP